MRRPAEPPRSPQLLEARWSPTSDEARYRRLLRLIFDPVADEAAEPEREAG
jgi:hypothetical protein